MNRSFLIVMRGYDRHDVDQALAQADAALQSASRSDRVAAAKALRSAVFRLRLRGYERGGVHEAMTELVTQLEAGS